MEKIKIKLNDNLSRNGLGFHDFEGNQKIYHKQGETVEVNRTLFITTKIQSGEILVVNSEPESKPESETKKK